ncbi:hypothetical protein SLE2022_160110 [Rubroshorea leprosula]
MVEAVKDRPVVVRVEVVMVGVERVEVVEGSKLVVEAVGVRVGEEVENKLGAEVVGVMEVEEVESILEVVVEVASKLGVVAVNLLVVRVVGVNEECKLEPAEVKQQQVVKAPGSAETVVGEHVW